LPRLLLLSGRLLLRGQDLFINAPALLSLPLDNTDGLFSHDHEWIVSDLVLVETFKQEL